MFHTALAYDARHALHAPQANLPTKPANYCEICPEIPQRVEYLWESLNSLGFTSKCLCLEEFEPASVAELTAPSMGGNSNNSSMFYTNSVHSDEHASSFSIQFADFASYINDNSEFAGRLAAGGVLSLTRVVCSGEVRNGFAAVRPPGHHATHGGCCVSGFCLYNNVAIAAANCRSPAWHLRNRISAGPSPIVPQRILVIDFDVHHGDGIQDAFYRESGVMYISIHRGAFDVSGKLTVREGGREKAFFPNTGLATEVGDGLGEGFNVNIPFEEAGQSDASYILAFNWIVLPIARQYKPDIIFVCAGFDASKKDTKSQADFMLTPHCYGWMTRGIMSVEAESATPARVVMALEGGYNIDEIAAGGVQCVKALMGESLDSAAEALPLLRQDTISTIQSVADIQRKYWKIPSLEEAIELQHW